VQTEGKRFLRGSGVAELSLGHCGKYVAGKLYRILVEEDMLVHYCVLRLLWIIILCDRGR